MQAAVPLRRQHLRPAAAAAAAEEEEEKEEQVLNLLALLVKTKVQILTPAAEAGGGVETGDFNEESRGKYRDLLLQGRLEEASELLESIVFARFKTSGGHSDSVQAAKGTQCACFTRTKVQILTPAKLLQARGS